MTHIDSVSNERAVTHQPAKAIVLSKLFLTQQARARAYSSDARTLRTAADQIGKAKYEALGLPLSELLFDILPCSFHLNV